MECRLAGEDRFLPVLQHVALSNKHIHHAGMGPYMLPDFEPIDAGGVEATKRAFLGAVDRGVYNQADHYFLWLWDNIPAVEALDLLLTVAIPKNVQDDHYFIFPSFTWRAVEWLGREYLPILMRPAVRYVTRFPTPGQVWRVSADGGSQARWRRDGKEIFYVSPDRQLMSASIALGTDSVKVDRIEPLFELRFPYGAYHAFDVTSDGQRFLVNTAIASAGAPQQVHR